MTIRTNYFSILKNRGLLKVLQDILDLSEFGILDSEKIAPFIEKLEERYNKGDIEAGNILERLYYYIAEYTEKMGDVILCEYDRAMLTYHCEEIEMNLLLAKEE